MFLFRPTILALIAMPLQLFAANDAGNFVASHASQYVNAGYGVSVKLPKRMTMCMPEPPYTANHGFIAVFDSQACNDVMDRPRIEFFIAYNLADAEKSLGNALSGQCQDGPANPTAIVSAGFPVYECSVGANGGPHSASYIFLYGAQRGRGGIAIHVDLYAHPYIREADLASARQLLTSVRWRDPSLGK